MTALARICSAAILTLRSNTPGATTPESFVELESHAGRGLPQRRGSAEPAEPTDRESARSSVRSISLAEISDVIAFWREAGPGLWFAKDREFDRRFRERFLSLHEAAARGALAGWPETASGALALVLLLDQYPRNAFRGTPRMYASDAMAREAATAAIHAGHDRSVATELQLFFYLPFAHSEDLADQERSVALVRRLGEPNLSHAEGHCDIVRRFGRFPHRNPILGRVMRAEEQRFLDEGGFAG
jgi:uncharacterized protein (DUF924 family)